ncbi:MAG: phosphatidate cytidylyltransferase [Prolixibacteraceae bacterium]
MKNIYVRGISGAVFIILTLGSIFLSKYTFFIYFGFVLSYTLFEFYRLAKNGGNHPQTINGIIISVYLFVAFFLYDLKIIGEIIFLGIIPALMIIPIIELFRNSEKPVQNIAYTLLGIAYIAFPFSVLNFIISPFEQNPEIYVPEALIGLFIILWANDTGAYLSGSLFGKTKMIAKISPNKTWEGAAGGAVFAVIISLVLYQFIGFLSPIHTIFVSLITVIAGTLGDLTESMFKRNFNVKDSGSIMPGHGGLLDRFDSMLFAAPIYFIYITLVLN